MKNYFSLQSLIHQSAEEIDWQGVYENCLPKVFHYFCYKVGDPSLAEDLTAITFEKAWSSRRSFNSEIAQIQAWLMGIARNVAGDHFRKPIREVSLEDISDKGLTYTPEDPLQENSEFEFILSVLSKFPERERELIAYKYGAELNNREIARLTGLSETNVGTILYRVVEKLRNEWESNHER